MMRGDLRGTKGVRDCLGHFMQKKPEFRGYTDDPSVPQCRLGWTKSGAIAEYPATLVHLIYMCQNLL